MPAGIAGNKEDAAADVPAIALNPERLRAHGTRRQAMSGGPPDLSPRTLREPQVDLGNTGIDREEDHGYALPKPVARARFLARERIARRVEAKIVVAKCANRNKAFRSVLEPRVQAALRNARYDGG